MMEDQTEKYKEHIELLIYFILLYIGISLVILFLSGSLDSVITRHLGWLIGQGGTTPLQIG